MAVVKVIEVISEGKTIDEAIKSAHSEVAKTVRNIKEVKVDQVSLIIDPKDSKKHKFQILSKVSFLVHR